MFETPILFIIFNRPETTEKVFEQIKKIKPKYLYVAADGPRLDKEGEIELCNRTRAIIQDINWDCELKTLYSNDNLGFSQRVKTALSWFFNEVSAGIVLEDDCLPNTSFFKFCELMLDKHKDNQEIQLISGTNFCYKPISETHDYFTGNFGYIWGWASWRRVVQNIHWETDYKLKEVKDKLISIYPNKEYVNHFYSIIYDNYKVKDCWDVEFFVFNLMNNKKNIFPNVNLVSNIGNSGTHYENSKNQLLNSKTFEIDFLKFKENNFAELSIKQIKFIIGEFNKKSNPLTLRDKIYLARKKMLNRFEL